MRIQNQFTGRVVDLDLTQPMTAERVRGIRRALCGGREYYGDTLGASGPQPYGYAVLLDRAREAIRNDHKRAIPHEV